MDPKRVRAVSFDLWDTVFADDSDEPKRTAAGLPPKPQARRELVHEALLRSGPIERAVVDCAYDVTDAAFRHVWHVQHVTWSVAERLGVLLAGLGRSLPEGELAGLARAHEEMELDPRPDLVPGAADAIGVLAGKYRLVVISDAIFSPGWALRKLLAAYGLAERFSGFVFSDEVGASKPAPELFHRAAELAGCEIEQLVHVGDREANDIAGPRAAGARSILLTACKDRGSDATRADAICDDYAALPAIIDSLSRERP
ncbi:MAG: HAD family hydrolase [Deltaproteobacteria bacterium]|nr:HAD family hydrolase [Deltaproteobacteria bacterium]